MVMKNKKVTLAFDFTPNHAKLSRDDEIKNEIRRLETEVPNIVDRRSKLPYYITHETGDYRKIMDEARRCFEIGLFFSCISTISIAAERFSIEISSKLKYKINGNLVRESEILGEKISQYKRLRLLLKGKLITESTFKLLDDIRHIRNKYIHPKETKATESDALEMIKKLNSIITSRFSDKYTFISGKLVKL